MGHTISGGHVVATGASLVLTDGIEAVGEFRCKPMRTCSVGGVKQAPSSGSVEAFRSFYFSSQRVRSSSILLDQEIPEKQTFSDITDFDR